MVLLGGGAGVADRPRGAAKPAVTPTGSTGSL